jgi:hypothetical protein
MRRVLICLATLVCAAFPLGAKAGDVVFSVVDARNHPVLDAVVTAYPDGMKPAPVGRFLWPTQMVQRDLQFDPFVLIVPVGADVAFPNHDAVRHHVYSFSPAKPFELKLYGRDETRSVRFDRPGVIALGCNIHDSMVAFIKVVDTPFAAKTDAKGEAVLHGAPAGAMQVHVWYPYQKAPNNEIVRAVRVAGAASERQSVQIDVRAAPDRRGGY